MNGAVKFHKATGPAFNIGEKWVSADGTVVLVLGVRQYPGSVATVSTGNSDYGVTYTQRDGTTCEKDAWSFQTRYNHTADINL